MSLNKVGIQLPEKPKLPYMDKVPTYASNLKPPKMAKRLTLMRGPELIHNEFIHKQYGIVVSIKIFKWRGKIKIKIMYMNRHSVEAG